MAPCESPQCSAGAAAPQPQPQPIMCSVPRCRAQHRTTPCSVPPVCASEPSCLASDLVALHRALHPLESCSDVHPISVYPSVNCYHIFPSCFLCCFSGRFAASSRAASSDEISSEAWRDWGQFAELCPGIHRL